MPETVFSKILRREIPAEIIYEDAWCLAFRDINPQAPIHVLIIPREELEGLQVAAPRHQALLGHLLLVAAQLAAQEGIAEKGYRCVVNAGPDGGQTVSHLHVHLLGGRHLSWPPG